MSNPGIRRVMLALGVAMLSVSAAAGSVSWNQTKNMEQAGRDLGEMWARKGALGIFKHIEACHRKHIVQAGNYTADAEVCLVQDVIHSQFSARMYSSMSRAAREMSGSPKPEAVLGAMNRRLAATARKFGFSPEEIEELVRLALETGAPVYLETLKLQMEAAARNRRADR